MNQTVTRLANKSLSRPLTAGLLALALVAGSAGAAAAHGDHGGGSGGGHGGGYGGGFHDGGYGGGFHDGGDFHGGDFHDGYFHGPSMGFFNGYGQHTAGFARRFDHADHGDDGYDGYAAGWPFFGGYAAGALTSPYYEASPSCQPVMVRHGTASHHYLVREYSCG